MTFFLLQWTKPSHVGRGFKAGDEAARDAAAARPPPLREVTVHEADPTPAPDFSAWGRTARPTAARHAHYGDPDRGCREDEEVVLAGRGRIERPVAPALGLAPVA